jgi:hypothetical protein
MKFIRVSLRDWVNVANDIAFGPIDNLNLNICSVPKPSTWAMMLLGFAGVGTMAYRRRKSALA